MMARKHGLLEGIDDKLAEDFDKIRAGLTYRRKVGKSRAWAKYYAAYRGDYGKLGLHQYNLLYSTLHTLRPNAYFRNPHVFFTPNQPNMWLESMLLETLINRLIKICRVGENIKLMLTDIFFCGVGIGKFGYSSVVSEKRDSIVSRYSKKGILSEFNADVRPLLPWFQRVWPAEVVVPWGTVSMRNVPWIAHGFLMRLKDARNVREYLHTDEMQPTTFGPSNDGKGIFADRQLAKELNYSYGKRDAVNDTEFVLMWEMHDARTGEMRVFSEGCKEYHLVTENHPLQFDGRVPFLGCNPNEDGVVFWSQPDAAVIWSQQKELVSIKTHKNEIRKSAGIRAFINENALKDNAQKARLESNDPVSIIYTNAPPADAVASVNFNIPQTLLIEEQNMINEARDMHGIGPNRQGQFASGRRSATEANYVANFGDIRLEDRRQYVKDLLTDVVHAFCRIIWEFWDFDIAMEVMGPENARYLPIFKGKELMGDYSLRIDIDAEMPYNQQTRTQNLMGVYQATANDPTISPEQRQLLRMKLMTAFPEQRADEVMPKKQEETPQPMPMQQVRNQMIAGGR